MAEAKEYHSTEIFRKVSGELESRYGRESESLTYILLDELLGIGKIACLSDRIIRLDDQEMTSLTQAVQRLNNDEPVQYILGKSWFFGRTFFVSNGVLIPRQETEEMIILVRKQNSFKKPRIMDIGCGSGCIAISLALEIPDAELLAIDNSPEAVQVSRKNARNLNAVVEVYQHDIFDRNWPWPEFDILVSNPPYVTEAEKKAMSRNVLAYEPAQALFVNNDDPLIFYRRIVEIAKTSLRSLGLLFFEINESFGARVQELMESADYKNITIDNDIHGKERFVSGRKK
jgi:release factor glutamine methyltransferase